MQRVRGARGQTPSGQTNQGNQSGSRSNQSGASGQYKKIPKQGERLNAGANKALGVCKLPHPDPPPVAEAALLLFALLLPAEGEPPLPPAVLPVEPPLLLPVALGGSGVPDSGVCPDSTNVFDISCRTAWVTGGVAGEVAGCGVLPVPPGAPGLWLAGGVTAGVVPPVVPPLVFEPAPVSLQV